MSTSDVTPPPPHVGRGAGLREGGAGNVCVRPVPSSSERTRCRLRSRGSPEARLPAALLRARLGEQFPHLLLGSSPLPFLFLSFQFMKCLKMKKSVANDIISSLLLTVPN